MKPTPPALEAPAEPSSTPYARSVASPDGRIRACEAWFEPDAWSEHSHDELQISIPLGRAAPLLTTPTGSGRKATVEVRPGTVSVIPPGQPHQVDWPRAGTVRTVYLSRDLLSAQAPRWVEICGGCGVHDPFVVEAVRELVGEVRDPSGDLLYLESLAGALATHLAKRYAAAAERNPRSLPPQETRRLQRAVERIREGLGEPLRLEDLAREAALSASHFSRCFRKATGTTPYRYLMRLRVDEAKNLLAETDESVVQVALRVGYSSQSRFAEIFRRCVGMTPSDFRRHRRRR